MPRSTSLPLHSPLPDPCPSANLLLFGETSGFCLSVPLLLLIRAPPPAIILCACAFPAIIVCACAPPGRVPLISYYATPSLAHCDVHAEELRGPPKCPNPQSCREGADPRTCLPRACFPRMHRWMHLWAHPWAPRADAQPPRPKSTTSITVYHIHDPIMAYADARRPHPGVAFSDRGRVPGDCACACAPTDACARARVESWSEIPHLQAAAGDAARVRAKPLLTIGPG
jgi:hypothetical protein